ncbi:MAG: hypothetical protein RR540_00830 [Oscillospiraceae bacterium]
MGKEIDTRRLNRMRNYSTNSTNEKLNLLNTKIVVWCGEYYEISKRIFAKTLRIALTTHT